LDQQTGTYLTEPKPAAPPPAPMPTPAADAAAEPIAAPSPEHRALADFCLVLLNSPEFLYVD
jgi:hypothetical protein